MVRTADKPCWGLNGTDYRMGANGAVQGDINHYGDYVYSQEAMKIISEHDLQIPLYFCAHLPLHLSCMSPPLVQTVHSIDRAVSADIAFQCNHEPIEAPDSYIEMVSVPAPFASFFRSLLQRSGCAQRNEWRCGVTSRPWRASGVGRGADL